MYAMNMLLRLLATATVDIMYMNNLLGWLETRLDQIILNHLTGLGLATPLSPDHQQPRLIIIIILINIIVTIISSSIKYYYHTYN